jgi:hypothetical protein
VVSGLNQARAYRFLVWALIGVLIAGLGALALYTHGGTRLEAINAYYGKLLNRTELTGVRGPHYWKDRSIVWAGRRHVKKSGDFGVTTIDDGALPETFRGPARSISESIWADKSNVYLRQGNGFKRVLTDFKCWYVCGSRLKTGDLVIGEYGSRIYRLDAKTGETRLLFEKPPGTRHFHFTAVDPFTGDIYTSLGDAHKAEVTGIMRSQDGGETWQWLDKATGGSRTTHRQPTAVYFDKDAIYFGKDNRPPGILVLDRKSGRIEQVFIMSKFFKFWFTGIIKVKGSFWAIWRSFTNKPKPSFGLLWWSGDGKTWVPVQFFTDAPIWLQAGNEDNLISLGFLRKNSDVIAFNVPDAAQMAEWVKRGPSVALLGRLFARLTGESFDRQERAPKQRRE